MKNKFVIVAISGILILSLTGLKAYIDTRTNIQDSDRSVITSASEIQYLIPKYATQSELENKFLNDSYKFSMGPKYIEFNHKVDYKTGDASSAKKDLKKAADFLNKLTKDGMALIFLRYVIYKKTRSGLSS